MEQLPSSQRMWRISLKMHPKSHKKAAGRRNYGGPQGEKTRMKQLVFCIAVVLLLGMVTLGCGVSSSQGEENSSSPPIEAESSESIQEVMPEDDESNSLLPEDIVEQSIAGETSDKEDFFVEQAPDDGTHSSLPSESEIPSNEEVPVEQGDFILRMVDRDGAPIQNTKAVVNVEEQASFLAITNSRGEITVPEDYFEGLRYGVEYGVNLELDSVTGGQGVETQPFVLTPAAWSEPVVVSWPFPSPYEALKTAPDRVEITIQDGEGNPIPDLWVIASFGGTQEPDRGGSKGDYEGYTDQEGTVYFTQYHPGEIPVGISPAGESYRQLGTISVTGEPGVQSFLFVLE